MVKNVLVVAVKAFISFGLIWVALQSVEVDEAIRRASLVNPQMLGIAVGLLILQAGLGGIRWHAVGKAIGTNLPLIGALRLFYVGLFFNQVLPGGTSGDLVRMFLSYRAGLTLRSSINSVMLERLITLVALLLLVIVILPFFSIRVGNDFFYWGKGLSGLVFVLMIVGLCFLMALDRLPKRFKDWRVFRGLSYLGQDTRKIFLNLKNLFPIMILGLLPHLNFSLCAYSLALGLGLQVELFDCIALMPPIMLITTIPLSIGGWGIRENAIIIGFSLIGVSSDAALALSVLLGLIALATALPGGLVWLLSKERKENINFAFVKNELKPKNIQ